MSKPIILIILDGWGIAPPGPGNAVSLSSLPIFNKLWASFPHGKLLASGEAVGLPRGERGNSETGHLNLGAGRIVYQELPRINMSIADGSFFKNNAFLKAIKHVEKNKSKLHLMGLIGQGGVHSSNEHLFALLRLAKEHNVENLFLHLFTDGRDSPPTSAKFYLEQVEKEIKEIGIGKIASISGRYYAMDRDNRWERTEKVYRAIVEGNGETANSAFDVIEESYKRGRTDEFIEPTIIIDEKKKSFTLIEDNDAVIFFNYRIDRPRQLVKALVLEDLTKAIPQKPYFDPYAEKYYKKTFVSPLPLRKTFIRKKLLKNLFFVTMTEYEKGLPVEIAFPPIKINITLSRIFAEKNYSQLHLSETEKERFITYYFNGQNEEKNLGEDWVICPSPNVPTYDLEPAMAAVKITKILIENLNRGIYKFILVNFANPDMVGHTGIIPAAVTACETVDSCLGNIVNNVLALDATCIITADHGNVEEMINPITGGVDTEHSINPVPFIVIDRAYQGISKELPSGILADVAPTVLKLAEIPKPGGFTGKSLI